MRKRILNISMIFMIAAIMGACKKDAPLPDNLAGFAANSLGISETDAEMLIPIRLSRAVDQDISIVVQTTSEGVAYGEQYTTVPAASSSGEISVTIPRGNNEVAIRLIKSTEAFFDGEEKILFKIQSASDPVLVGSAAELTVNFSEILAEEALVEVSGGGAEYGNTVFIDLSANRQTPVDRDSWDLGFYAGQEFGVILNYATGMMARALDKNNLNDVSAADTANFIQEMSFNAFSHDALAYIDYPDGDLSRTAIAAVSATPEENKVYIINRGTGVGTPAPARGWKKIRVVRNASGGYTLQHADIASTSFSEIQIDKVEDHLFAYASFEDGIVDVAPAKQKWDIAWTYFSNLTTYMGDEIPYGYQDFIIQNREVETAMVPVSQVSFENFAEADLAGLSFTAKQNGIGSDWRAGGGPGSAPAIRSDRFYVVKDTDGNYYKLKFLSLTKDGERGYPSFEHALVKKGAR